MSVDGNFFGYSGGQLQPLASTHSETLTVADSWLVADGNSVALERHFARFSSGVAADTTAKAELVSFFSAAVAATPRVGNWFPRIEYRADCPSGERLFFRLREAPELTETVTLWSFPEPDPRQRPETKGPDLSLCQQLRRAANLHGADEAVLLDEDGFIADGALSAVLWWREDVLCAPDESTRWLPSITRQLALEIAEQAGFSVRLERAQPGDLRGCEVWSLSSLQGVRGVTHWSGVEIRQPTRFGSFRKRLQLLAKPIH
jgi:branched-subunit amino acid aminotransferase/4-amino-4-deoxychorismate lyase